MRNPVLYMACIAAGLPPIHAELAYKRIEYLSEPPSSDLIVVVYRHRQRVYRTGALDYDHRDRDGTYEHIAVMHPREWFTQPMASDAVRWLWMRERGFNTVSIPPEWFDGNS